jgi:carboxymethylenebutenolidase
MSTEIWIDGKAPDGDKVTWKRGDGEDVPGYYYEAEGAKEAVIVLQEWWGVTEQIKLQALHITSKGYTTLIPDLYRGKLGVEVEEAHHLMSSLDFKLAVEDIRGAVAWLRAEKGIEKVGIIGFCMGGALTVAAAALVDGLDAACPFYGTPPPELCDPSTMKIPVQGHFGDKDSHAGFADVAAANGLEEKLKASGCTYEVHHYPTVGHAFMNDTAEAVATRLKQLGEDEGAHDADAVRDAWKRVFEWFGKYLKGSRE